MHESKGNPIGHGVYLRYMRVEFTGFISAYRISAQNQEQVSQEIDMVFP